MTTLKQDLLIELGTEELPPKALAGLSRDFESLLCGQLQAQRLSFGETRRFATPRRLAVLVRDLDTAQADEQTTRVGPALSAAFNEQNEPTPAALGFAKSCGVAVDSLIQVDAGGVTKLAYSIEVKGSQTEALLDQILQHITKQLPIPKRMRWGSSREEFVRPVHWLVVLFGNSVVPVSLFGVAAGADTWGHRFMHNEAIRLDCASDYEMELQEVGGVIPDFAQRRDLIRELVQDEAAKLGAIAVIEEDLLDEVASLVEYPVALTGNFDPSFLDIPPEALVLTMKSHQKCFYLTGQDGSILPKFVAISNLISKQPEIVVSGYERVIRPRLADALFFFDHDKQRTLESRIPDLASLKFQDRLGSVLDKTRRIERLAAWTAETLGLDVPASRRASALSKCDLLTDMVGEFAELQGLMGYYYALHDGEPEVIARAIDEHYQPRHAGAPVPTTDVGALVAIADKMDTIVGMFGIGQPPTGSKDPFALRRAAIGILRILIEKNLNLSLIDCIEYAVSGFDQLELVPETTQQVTEFFYDRFNYWYAEEGVDNTVFQSVMAVRPERPLDFHHRIQAVQHFTRLEEAAALAAANKRVMNILSKSEFDTLAPTVDSSLLQETQEQVLWQEIQAIESDVAPLFDSSRYSEGLCALAPLKASVDEFFDSVLVNAEDTELRANRYALLQRLRGLFLRVADVSCLHKT